MDGWTVQGTIFSVNTNPIIIIWNHAAFISLTCLHEKHATGKRKPNKAKFMPVIQSHDVFIALDVCM